MLTQERSQEISPNNLTKEELVEFLNAPSGHDLFMRADFVRKENVGNNVHLRGLIEFSNYCKNNCLYCGIRGKNILAKRYRLSFEEILKYAMCAKNAGLQTIVLQSGEDVFFDTEKIIKIIKEIKKLDVALTLSVGEKSFEEYKEFKKAGADRYLIRIETTSEELYQKMHPEMSFKKRLQCLEDLKTLGFETGTGVLVGLPEQSIESLADDILFFREFDADMIGIGALIVNEETPLKGSKDGSFDLARRVVALTRIMCPTSNIPATTAMETIRKNGRILTLQSGANVVMPNVVEWEVNKNYELYKNKVSNQRGIQETIERIKQDICSIGREIEANKGFRKK